MNIINQATICKAKFNLSKAEQTYRKTRFEYMKNVTSHELQLSLIKARIRLRKASKEYYEIQNSLKDISIT